MDGVIPSFNPSTVYTARLFVTLQLFIFVGLKTFTQGQCIPVPSLQVWLLRYGPRMYKVCCKESAWLGKEAFSTIQVAVRNHRMVRPGLAWFEISTVSTLSCCENINIISNLLNVNLHPNFCNKHVSCRPPQNILNKFVEHIQLSSQMHSKPRLPRSLGSPCTARPPASLNTLPFRVAHVYWLWVVRLATGQSYQWLLLQL